MTRLAKSIETLGNEVRARSPLTTLYYYDDTPRRDSDHDPNLEGVVCALDIMEGHGLDLLALSHEIVDRRHPECAYVIHAERIASRNTGWTWQPYSGDSDHNDHIHVSVGVGRDGYKKPPYDSTAKWLEDQMGDIFCKKGDSNDAVKSLQLGLNRAWKGEPGYTGKDIVSTTGFYGDATAAAVFKVLGGATNGAVYGPDLHWVLLDKHAKLYAGATGLQGPAGEPGAPGRDGVVTSGTQFIAVVQ